MASLNGYLNAKSPSMRIIARLLLIGTPMSVWDVVAASGLSYSTVRAKMKILKDENAIHVDRWVRLERYGAKPTPVFAAGDYPDAPKNLKRPRSAGCLRKQKTEYYQKKHQAHTDADSIDWNGIMHSIVKGR